MCSVRSCVLCVQELLGLGRGVSGGASVPGMAGAAAMAAASSNRFLLPVSECSPVLESILEDLQRDPVSYMRISCIPKLLYAACMQHNCVFLSDCAVLDDQLQWSVMCFVHAFGCIPVHCDVGGHVDFQWPKAADQRPARCTGVALSIAVSLLQKALGWQGGMLMITLVTTQYSITGVMSSSVCAMHILDV
jgi:hypothetical protein